MADIWWKAHPTTYRLTDRVSSVYIERSHLDRAENAIAIINRRETVRLPAALVAVVLLGPGTRVTTARCSCSRTRARRCAGSANKASGCMPRGSAQPGAALLSDKRIWSVAPQRGWRWPGHVCHAVSGEDVSTLTMQQLRGREGARVRKVYRQQARQHGVPWNGRAYKAGDAFAVGDDLNRLLSAANAALYGICHAVIVGLGASPGLGFIHTGSATSFVMDIADLYKAEYTIPLAFQLAARGLLEERDARTALRDRIAGTGLLPRIIKDVKTLLAPEGVDLPDPEVNLLWDERGNPVPGGVNWSDDFDFPVVDPSMDQTHISVIGPEFDTPTTEAGES